jgi:hypothetical protein
LIPKVAPVFFWHYLLEINMNVCFMRQSIQPSQITMMAYVVVSEIPTIIKQIFAISLAFWNTYRRDDATAKDWLSGSGLQSMLEKKDRWQHK